MEPFTKFVLIMGLGLGFMAGKLDLDEKLKEAIHNQNVRLGKLNAKLLADELIGRKALAAGQD